MKNQQPELPLQNPNFLTLSCQAEELLTQAPKLRNEGWIIESVKVVGQSGYLLTCRKPTVQSTTRHT